jgi:IS1 family transposase
MQPVVGELASAEHYYSDDLAVYRDVIWPDHPDGSTERQHQVSEGKRDTYTVEGMNADLRTYLRRLKRRSRCFSRCIHALRQTDLI